jgi:hypothetical protein
VCAHHKAVPPKTGNTAQIFRRTTAPTTASRPHQLIKARPDDDYVTIEKEMIDIEQALMPEKPTSALRATVGG